MTFACRVNGYLTNFTTQLSIYTSSGSVTIPAGATTMTVEAWGGGGAGNKGTGSLCTAVAGNSGGTGGYSTVSFNVNTSNGKSVNFTVGAGGAANSGNGGATTVTSGSFTLSTITCNGGAGNGGAGGSVTDTNSGASNTAGYTGLSHSAATNSGVPGVITGDGSPYGSGGGGGIDGAHNGANGGSGAVVFYFQ